MQAVLLDDRSGADLWEAAGALDAPVVALSQSAEPEVVERAIVAGACKFVHVGGAGAADALSKLALAVSGQRLRLGKARVGALSLLARCAERERASAGSLR